MVRGALRSVLSDKLAAKHLVIVDKFDLKGPKTKSSRQLSRSPSSAKKVLLVDSKNENLTLAARICRRSYSSARMAVNTYDLVKHEWLFLSKELGCKLWPRGWREVRE